MKLNFENTIIFWCYFCENFDVMAFKKLNIERAFNILSFWSTNFGVLALWNRPLDRVWQVCQYWEWGVLIPIKLITYRVSIGDVDIHFCKLFSNGCIKDKGVSIIGPVWRNPVCHYWRLVLVGTVGLRTEREHIYRQSPVKSLDIKTLKS